MMSAAESFSRPSAAFFSNTGWPLGTQGAAQLRDLYIGKEEAEEAPSASSGIPTQEFLETRAPREQDDDTDHGIHIRQVVTDKASPKQYIIRVVTNVPGEDEERQQRIEQSFGPFLNLGPHVVSLHDRVQDASQSRQQSSSRAVNALLVPSAQILQPDTVPKSLYMVDDMQVASTPSQLRVNRLHPNSLQAPRYLEMLRKSRTGITRWLIYAPPPLQSKLPKDEESDEGSDTEEEEEAEEESTHPFEPLGLAQYYFATFGGATRVSSRYVWCVDMLWSKERFWQAQLLLRGVFDMHGEGAMDATPMCVWVPPATQAETFVWHPLLWLALRQAEPWSSLAYPIGIPSQPVDVLCGSQSQYGYTSPKLDLNQVHRDFEHDLEEHSQRLNDLITHLRRLDVPGTRPEERRVISITDDTKRTLANWKQLRQSLKRLEAQLQDGERSEQEAIASMIAFQRDLTEHLHDLLEFLNTTSPSAPLGDMHGDNEGSKGLTPLGKKVLRTLAEAATQRETLLQHLINLLDEDDSFHSELDGLVVEARDDLAETEERAKEAERTTSALQRQLEQAEKDFFVVAKQQHEAVEQARTARLQIESRDEQITKLERDLADQLDQGLKMAKQLEEMEEKLKQENQEKDERDAQISELSERAKQLRAELVAQAADKAESDRLRTRLEEVETEMQEIKTIVTKVQEQERLKRIEADESKKTVTALGKLAHTTKQRLLDSQMALKGAVAERDRLRTKADQLEAERTTASLRVKSLESTLGAARHGLDLLRQDVDRLQKSVAASEQRNRDLERQYEERVVAIRELRAQVVAKEETLAYLRRRKEELEAQVKTLQEEVGKLRAEIFSLRSEHLSTLRRLKHLREEYIKWADNAKSPTALQMALSGTMMNGASPLYTATYPVLRASSSSSSQPLLSELDVRRGAGASQPFLRILAVRDQDAGILGDGSLSWEERMAYVVTSILNDAKRRHLTVHQYATRGLAIFTRKRDEPWVWRDDAGLKPIETLEMEDSQAIQDDASIGESGTDQLAKQHPSWRRHHDDKFPVVLLWLKDMSIEPNDYYYCTDGQGRLVPGLQGLPRKGYIYITDGEPYGTGGLLVYNIPKARFGAVTHAMGYLPASRVDLYFEQMNPVGTRFNLAHISIEPLDSL